MESNPTHKRKVVGFLLSLAGAIFLADSQKCVTARSLLSLKAQQASAIREPDLGASEKQGTLSKGGGVAVGQGGRGALERRGVKAWRTNKRIGRMGRYQPADNSELQQWQEPRQTVA